MQGNKLKKEINREDFPRSNQKLKILYLMKILLEDTDEDHYLTLQQIVEKLKLYGVTAERKSLYSDIDNLRVFGLDVHGFQLDRTYYYHIVQRDFELSELKVLVDSVQSARFITEKKSKILIEKLEKYASKFQAEQMNRQVYVSGRVKSNNEKIYYSVDCIHEAIASDKKISFKYYNYGVDKKEVLFHDGMIYVVSPWAMCFLDQNYYLIAYDEAASEKQLKHFRVDKMLKTELVNEKRCGKEEYDKLDVVEYLNRLFGMFGGKIEHVELLCENSMANVIYDRFGLDTKVIKVDENHFKAVVEVAVSNIFLGWIIALDGVAIVGPDETVEKMKLLLKERYNQYFL